MNQFELNRYRTQFIKYIGCLSLFLPFLLSAQSSYLQMGMKDQQMLDRLEIKMQRPGLNFSIIKPYNRKWVTKEVEAIDSLVQIKDYQADRLSKIDQYNMQRFLMNNSEWSAPRASYYSQKPILKTFYTTKGNLLEVQEKDFFLAVNPIISYHQGQETGYDRPIFQNTRGAVARGLIGKKLGFHLYFTENQERTPRYVQQWVRNGRGVPGAGFYKALSIPEGYDYFDVRGSISWQVAKAIEMQFGYDKNFIGNGLRSLYLSDFSNNNLFLKINTRIWKFNYENLFMELIPQQAVFNTGNQNYPRKYFRMNHLSMNVTKWLNVGLFDAAMFGRVNHFDFMYMIPVMFVLPQQQQIGSADNSMVGIDMKMNLLKRIQVYGKINFDEFWTEQLFSRKDWWGNKYGYQLGMKYVDVLGVKNVDLQLEMNRVRPYMYSHFDTAANWTHYNQPFAHPLGANFQEYIAVLKAQPTKRLFLQAKAILFTQGIDSLGVNMGANPLINNKSRPREYAWYVGSGDKAEGLMVNLLASYELFENLFIDVNYLQRNYSTQLKGASNTTVFSAGVRWNIGRRDFDF